MLIVEESVRNRVCQSDRKLPKFRISFVRNFKCKTRGLEWDYTGRKKAQPNGAFGYFHQHICGR